ncbi:hypothetical protein U14_05214 [Candidatus Moduliflexus flocculans]|uniref:Uncharacterized protein n=1 Tax=Candidatus Moduliflexus flocculans TaxID=1499966 RepID=A0A081BRA6_9BACT|nr:hypothetical protein U14_05214 [Candidatus Moduliflexus flocculans]
MAAFQTGIQDRAQDHELFGPGPGAKAGRDFLFDLEIADRLLAGIIGWGDARFLEKHEQFLPMLPERPEQRPHDGVRRPRFLSQEGIELPTQLSDRPGKLGGGPRERMAQVNGFLQHPLEPIGKGTADRLDAILQVTQQMGETELMFAGGRVELGGPPIMDEDTRRQAGREKGRHGRLSPRRNHADERFVWALPRPGPCGSASDPHAGFITAEARSLRDSLPNRLIGSAPGRGHTPGGRHHRPGTQGHVKQILKHLGQPGVWDKMAYRQIGRHRFDAGAIAHPGLGGMVAGTGPTRALALEKAVFGHADGDGRQIHHLIPATVCQGFRRKGPATMRTIGGGMVLNLRRRDGHLQGRSRMPDLSARTARAPLAKAAAMRCMRRRIAGGGTGTIAAMFGERLCGEGRF